jgi:hypothetical protein
VDRRALLALALVVAGCRHPHPACGGECADPDCLEWRQNVPRLPKCPPFAEAIVEPDPPEAGAQATPGGGPMRLLPAEQTLHTPVPLYVEASPGVAATEANLRYKPFGGVTWQGARMVRSGRGFAALIPCRDIVTPGDLKYFITLTDAAGAPLEEIGSRKEPLRVTIKPRIEGEAPALPGRKPPPPCPTDCEP